MRGRMPGATAARSSAHRQAHQPATAADLDGLPPGADDLDAAVHAPPRPRGWCGGRGGRCDWLARSVRLHLRSFVAFNGAILLWTGLWDVCDLYLVQGTWARDLAYAFAGVALLLVTNTFFATTGIDQELLRSGRPRFCLAWTGQSRLVVRSAGSLLGALLFWVGTYNLFDLYVYAPTVPYDLLCFACAVVALGATGTLLGTAGISGGDDDDDEATVLIELDSASTALKAKLYSRGLVAATASVVLWKGCCSMLNEHVAPDTAVLQIWYVISGFACILGANSLIENAGLERLPTRARVEQYHDVVVAPSEHALTSRVSSASGRTFSSDVAAASGLDAAPAPASAAAAAVAADPALVAPAAPAVASVATPPAAGRDSGDAGSNPPSPVGGAAASSASFASSSKEMVLLPGAAASGPADAPRRPSLLLGGEHGRSDDDPSSAAASPCVYITCCPCTWCPAWCPGASSSSSASPDALASSHADSSSASSPARPGCGACVRAVCRYLNLWLYVRGILAMTGVIIYWTGAENLLGYVAHPSAWLATAYTLGGLVVMMMTNTVFLQAGVITPLSWGKRYAMLPQDAEDEDRARANEAAAQAGVAPGPATSNRTSASSPGAAAAAAAAQSAAALELAPVASAAASAAAAPVSGAQALEQALTRPQQPLR